MENDPIEVLPVLFRSLESDNTLTERMRELLLGRAMVGIAHYGVPLTVFNGRNPRRDMREEMLDLLMYNQQAAIENPDHVAAHDFVRVLVVMLIVGMDDLEEKS